MTVAIRSFHLPDSGWADAKAIRQLVFVEEQACPPDEEWDAWDEPATHLLLPSTTNPQQRRDGAPIPITREPPSSNASPFYPTHEAADWVRASSKPPSPTPNAPGSSTQTIHAQSHLERFYERLGFVRTGAAFVEAGIPHVPMTRTSEEV